VTVRAANRTPTDSTIAYSRNKKLNAAQTNKRKVKYKMKKTITILLLLCLTFTMCFSTIAIAEDYENNSSMIMTNNNSLRFSSAIKSNDILAHATHNLALFKESLWHISELFGFTLMEIGHMQLGNPFTIYIFNDSYELADTNSIVFPLLLGHDIIGVMEAAYNTLADQWSFTFGKSFGDELNKLQHQASSNRDFAICRIGDILFAANGKSTSVIFNEETEARSNFSEPQMNFLAASVINDKTSFTFVDVKTPIAGELLDVYALEQSYTLLRVELRQLDVRHVPQGNGICGAAAWAAILNYRFTSANYTTATMTKAMTYAGIPMPAAIGKYGDYANNKYNANCVTQTSPPSISNVINWINSNRPVMGGWKRADGVLHAINIIGYETTQGSNITYYIVRNPWDSTPFAQGVIVYGSAPTVAVYVHSGVSWTLAQAVR